MNKIIITALLLLWTSAQAEEMKCAAGKCTSGKETTTKKVPEKPKKSDGAMTAEEHAKMLADEKKVSSEKKSEKRALTSKAEEQSKYKSREGKLTIKQLFNVRTIKVKKEQITQKQTNYGFIVAEHPNMIDVVAWYSGFVEELYADKLYEKVTKGQVLAKVYSPEVYKAKQDYLNALKYNNQRPSASMVNSSKIKLELLNVSEKEIEDIRKNRRVDKLTTIFAPHDGWIFEKNINEGSSFNSKNKLFQIVDLSTVWMEAKLYQDELLKLNTLKEFTVKIKGFDQTFKATKELLYPMLDPKEATATLRLRIDNSDGILKPGMYATLASSATAKSRLLIPRTAIIRKEGKWYAFLATDFKGEYEPVKLDVKPINAQYYEVLSGLHEGESIVDNALFMMDSDAQINSIY
ncbi:Probable Co/Zn/Cd efflux system membrane fusion protein [hydrothermal vent metagenome]|uniref:Probable Co/Zn/Cd efflux system membrane fusion protein n=1 Tax=hydrothermal vent metagenome TaxID=652676 RepID=A0A1W1EDG2_9ZZZZ